MTVLNLQQKQPTPAERDATDAARARRDFDEALAVNKRGVDALATERQQILRGYLTTFVRLRRDAVPLTHLFPVHADFLSAALLEDQPDKATELQAKHYIIAVEQALKTRAGGAQHG